MPGNGTVNIGASGKKNALESNEDRIQRRMLNRRRYAGADLSGKQALQFSIPGRT
jgi:hypothetical protein